MTGVGVDLAAWKPAVAGGERLAHGARRPLAAAIRPSYPL